MATEGRPDPEPAWLPAAPPLVAIAVGKTNDGESFPAKPEQSQPNPSCNGPNAHTKLGEASAAGSTSVVVVKCGEEAHLSMTTAGVWLAILIVYALWRNSQDRDERVKAENPNGRGYGRGRPSSLRSSSLQVVESSWGSLTLTCLVGWSSSVWWGTATTDSPVAGLRVARPQPRCSLAQRPEQ